MSVQKTATEIINEASVAASATTALGDCTAVDCSAGIQLVFTVALDFNASATAGAEVTLWPSYDGTNYDTAGWSDWAWSIAVDAGNSIQLTSEPISPAVKYLKIKVENKDSSYAITNLVVNATKQTA